MMLMPDMYEIRRLAVTLHLHYMAGHVEARGGLFPLGRYAEQRTIKYLKRSSVTALF